MDLRTLDRATLPADVGPTRSDAPIAMWSWLAAAVLVAGIGFVCQRGNTCAVATVDDLVFRRSPARMLALVYTWAIVAGGLAIVHQFSSQQVSSSPITWWS